MPRLGNFLGLLVFVCVSERLLRLFGQRNRGHWAAVAGVGGYRAISLL